MDQAQLDRTSPPREYSGPHAVYTYFGFAAYWAQLLELMMLDLLAAIRIADGEEVDDGAYRAAFDRLDRHTLGMLLRKCREGQKITIPEDDESLLQEALAKRNYLMHRFFSVHDAELLDDDRLLVNELRELSATLAAARQTAESLYLGIVRDLDLDGKMAEQILRLGTAWQNVIMK